MIKTKENKAITLVALIITIIILLILAGITIAQLSSNGLFDKAKQAKEESENAILKEETELAKYENEINSYIFGDRNGVTEVELWSGLADQRQTYNFTNENAKITDYNYVLVLYCTKNGSDKQSMLIHKSQIVLSSADNRIQLTGYDQRYTTFYFNEKSFTVHYTDGNYICINKIIGIN